MKEKVEVYLFGQILGTHSFLLKGGFLKPDEYSEIEEQFFLPGGEPIPPPVRLPYRESDVPGAALF